MRGQLEDLGRLLKMSFCQDCLNSYYGSYHPENPALIHVLAARAVGSGVAGAYQLDHIVPISTCWEFEVPEVSASDTRNLQVIPWLVNLSRGSGIGLEDLVGWPRKKVATF
jgi:hypothetical protein